jgi:transposase-like protein
MTSTIMTDEILKQDRRGRVRVAAERRQALLAEFDRSGLSAAQFARMAGVKYQTFANWRQQQRKRRAAAGEKPGTVLIGRGPIRLMEAEVAETAAEARSGSAALLVELPGGSRLRVEGPSQLAMAAELLALIAQRSRAC